MPYVIVRHNQHFGPNFYVGGSRTSPEYPDAIKYQSRKAATDALKALRTRSAMFSKHEVERYA